MSSESVQEFCQKRKPYFQGCAWHDIFTTEKLSLLHKSQTTTTKKRRKKEKEKEKERKRKRKKRGGGDDGGSGSGSGGRSGGGSGGGYSISNIVTFKLYNSFGMNVRIFPARACGACLGRTTQSIANLIILKNVNFNINISSSSSSSSHHHYYYPFIIINIKIENTHISKIRAPYREQFRKISNGQIKHDEQIFFVRITLDKSMNAYNDKEI
ncbi:hypothetical protein V1477_019555 [Vespula maculifrons]|uniref:Uncharacterized protein n=1 Tax=Vespula maculifrons TaxID=7453 RepID=A0ABD2AQS8_VESMC